MLVDHHGSFTVGADFFGFHLMSTPRGAISGPLAPLDLALLLHPVFYLTLRLTILMDAE
jgi:hypothetical protein